MLRDATSSIRTFAMAGIFGSSALAFAAIQRNLPKIARVSATLLSWCKKLNRSLPPSELIEVQWQKATWIVSVGALGGYAGIHFAGPSKSISYLGTEKEILRDIEPDCLRKLVLLPDSKLADEARRM